MTSGAVSYQVPPFCRRQRRREVEGGGEEPIGSRFAESHGGSLATSCTKGRVARGLIRVTLFHHILEADPENGAVLDSLAEA